MPEQFLGQANQEVRQEHDRLVRIGRKILLNAPQSFIDIDEEADGIAGYGSMLSFGGVTPDDQRFYIELKPGSELFVPSQRQFCEEHGLEHDRLMEEGVDPEEATHRIVNWINVAAGAAGKKPVYSAFNSGFDFGLFNLYCIKYGIKNPFGISSFDLKSKALGLDGEWNWRATSKGNLPEILLPAGDFTHNALEDAVYQQKIHFALAAYLMEKYSGL